MPLCHLVSDLSPFPTEAQKASLLPGVAPPSLSNLTQLGWAKR